MLTVKKSLLITLMAITTSSLLAMKEDPTIDQLPEQEFFDLLMEINEASLQPLSEDTESSSEDTDKIIAEEDTLEYDLLAAASNNDAQEVRNCIARGANVNVYAPERLGGMTALLYAVSEQYPEIIAELLAVSGIDVNARDSMGCTALMHAVHHNDLATIRLLLPMVVASEPKNIDKKNNLGRTPLIHAVENHHVDAARLLLEHGADVDATDSEKMTSLMCAAESANLPMVQLLLEYKANVNLINNTGTTALLIAAGTQYGEEVDVQSIVELLIAADADGNYMSPDGCTSLIAALEHNFYLQPLLIDSGCMVNVSNADGWTPLMLALKKRNAERIQLLLNAGATMTAHQKELVYECMRWKGRTGIQKFEGELCNLIAIFNHVLKPLDQEEELVHPLKIVCTLNKIECLPARLRTLIMTKLFEQTHNRENTIRLLAWNFKHISFEQLGQLMTCMNPDIFVQTLARLRNRVCAGEQLPPRVQAYNKILEAFLRMCIR